MTRVSDDWVHMFGNFPRNPDTPSPDTTFASRSHEPAQNGPRSVHREDTRARWFALWRMSDHAHV